MTEQDQQSLVSGLIKSAFTLAIENCGGKPRVLAALDVSESWMYICIKKAKLPIDTALKLQCLTKGEFKWSDLAPDTYQEINAVSEYLIK